MKIPINEIIEESYIRRTERLLRLVRKKFGPETHLLVKKILLVSLYVDYYQRITAHYVWVSYCTVLARNEKIALNNDSTIPFPTSEFILGNSISYQFLGVEAKKRSDSSVPLSKLEDEVEFYCKNYL